jgi:RES domain-containing protein
MFGDNPPDRENVRGARWNPPQIPTIYTSLERHVAIAEGDYAISVQPRRPTAERRLYPIHVRLMSVIDLRDRPLLRELGIGEPELAGLDHTACRQLGGAVEWLQHDGLLVPSARAPGANLVIFMANMTDPSSRFEPGPAEILADQE